MTHRSKKTKQKNSSFIPRYWKWGIALIGIIALAVIFWPKPPVQSTSSINSLPVSISVQEAYSLREEGAYILDVRSQAEWQEIHIPGSTLIPLEQLESRLTELPTDAKIVVVCRSGNRSTEGRDLLLNTGFSLVTSMEGGVTSWQSKGYETISGN